MKTLLLLMCSSSGYALFQRQASEITNIKDVDVQKSINLLEKFSQMVTLKGFIPFTSP